VNLAARGLRDMDFGKERLGDPLVRAQVWRQALKVYAEAALTSAAATAVLYSIFGMGAAR
jgi:hypothetical protein